MCNVKILIIWDYSDNWFIILHAFFKKAILPTVDEAGNIKHKAQHPHGYWEQSDNIVVIKSNKPYPSTENIQRKWHRRALCPLSGLTLVPPSAYLLNFSRVERFHTTLNSRQQNHLCCYQSNSVCIKMHLRLTGGS